MKTVVKSFNYRDMEYVIVYNGKYYMTVAKEFIDENGNTNKALTYVDGLHTNETLEGCIADTKADLDIKHYMSQGMSMGEAYCKVFNITDKENVEAVKACFA